MKKFKKVFMFILNGPAHLFLALFSASRFYIRDGWRDEVATSVPFWKWGNWKGFWEYWK